MWFTVHHKTSIRCRFERKRLFPSADKNGFIPHAFGWSNEDKTTVKKKFNTEYVSVRICDGVSRYCYSNRWKHANVNVQ